MRNYQTKQNKGGVADTINAERYGAGEFNSLAVESENAVSKTGQSLAPADGAGEKHDQLSKAMFINGASAPGFQDNGSANSYELTPLTGASGLTIPESYDHFEGGLVMFKPAHASTGASTLKIGQTTSTYLGSKKLLKIGGGAITSGFIEVDRYQIAQYDSAADGGSGAFILIGTMSVGPENTAVGRVVQVQESRSSSLITVSNKRIPTDDTIPQITEGDQIFSVSITPKNSANILTVDVGLQYESGDGAIITALFLDSTANAIAANRTDSGNGAMNTLHMKHEFVAGTTSTIVVRLRIGSGTSSGVNVYINGDSGSRRFGGVSSSYLRVEERRPN